jgi:hypothetical protein
MQKRTKIAGNKMQKRSGKPGFYFLKGVARVALELRGYSPAADTCTLGYNFIYENNSCLILILMNYFS